jgi:predicted dehydrogenase
MRVAIVGCGRVGAKRARALPPSALAAVADTDPARAEALAAAHPGCAARRQWSDAVQEADLVIVATTHDALVPVALEAVRAGKHVLVEKPGARSQAELEPLARAARERGVTVAVGFNHRFHPALQKAHQLAGQGAVGEPCYVRARYGHGGRPGYEREWRADPAVAGGGELLDQGVHLVDLARWFLGPLALRGAHLPTYFWAAPVEDNAFLHLEGAGGRTAWLHASWTEWQNLFSFELFGRTGVLKVDGLGGSYGPERLTLARMTPGMGPPPVEHWPFPGDDTSWAGEYRALLDAIEGRPSAIARLDDALAVLEVVDAAYARSGRGAAAAVRP